MKRIAFIVAVLVAFAWQAQCQVTSTTQVKTMTVSAAEDTMTNTATSYLYSPIVSETRDLFFRLVITKVSGTVGGTATLEGYNGFTWVTVATDSLTATAGQYSAASATLADATATYYFMLPAPKAVYYKYRLKVATDQTGVCAPIAQMSTYYRKP